MSEDEEYIETWKDLPKNRVIFITKRSPLVRGVLLRSITSHFQIPAAQYGTLLAYVSDNVVRFYAETYRRNNSPWKGMHMYIPGKLIFSTDPESQHQLIWILMKLSKTPKILVQAGISLQYICLPTNQIRIDFYIDHAKINNSLIDFIPKLTETMKHKYHILLRDIIKGDEKETPFDPNDDNEVDNCEQRRQEDMNFEQFFTYINVYKDKHDHQIPNFKLNESDLNCDLMQYQKDTVRWMLYRELNHEPDGNIEWMIKSEKLASDTSLVYYPSIGAIALNEMTIEERKDIEKRFTLKGGILADEMGLGKTIQALSLIATNRKHSKVEIYDESGEVETVNRDESKSTNSSIAQQIKLAESSYAEMKGARQNQADIRYNLNSFCDGETILCSNCSQMCSAKICGWDFDKFKNEKFQCSKCTSESENRRAVGTTLIILPESLIFQWFTEISKHCSDNIKVMFYFGIRKHGYLQPCEMDSYDVILTTYDTLRNEMSFSEEKGPPRNLRNESKTLNLTSSLMHVEFWRIIVDESQVLPHGVSSQLTRMLMKLHAENWWCVTGTPLVKSIAGIYPLFNFLNLFPFGSPQFFSQYVHPQYLNFALSLRDEALDKNNLPRVFLLEILSKMMSRKTKQDKSVQLKLPKLTEVEKIIYFTTVEERQYKDEKERLRNIVERAIGNADNSDLLSDLQCREKVLQELRLLRQIILLGQRKTESDKVSCVLAPETVIFKLIKNKKTTIKANFREYLSYSLGVAGVQILMDMPQTAIETYSSALINYDELILAERNHLPEIKNDSSRDDSPCLLEEDEDDDFDGEDDGSAEKKKKPNKLNELNGFLGGIHQISKKYMKSKNLNLDPTSRKSERNGRVNEREIEEITRPKDAKRSRLDVEEEDEMETNEEKSNTPCSSTQDEGNLEYVKGQKHIQKLAFAAIEPITIDTTQEVHLILNMYNIQLSMGFPQADRVSLDRLQQIFVRYFQLELRAIEFIANDLPIFSQMWTKDKRNLMYQVSEFFGMMGIRCSAIRDTGALYENGKIIRDTVKKHHFPHLPFVALYDTNKLTPIGRVHREKTCMGRCNNIVMECEVFNGQPCLSLPDVMSKTLDHFKKIDEKRKELDQKANKLVEFIMKMANPNMLITVFSENTDDRSSSNRTPEIQKMLNVLLCDHKIIKGTLNDKAFVDEYYWKEHSCLICDFWCKTYSFKFDAGFSTYHGLSRNKSGVAEWAVYLANHFAPSKKDAVTFEKRIITPFFEQIGDVLHAYRLIALTLAEIVDRFDELSQAQRRITDINVSDFFDQNDNIPEPPIATKRIEFKNHYEAEIKVVIESVRKDVKELRYLMNLMKKQLDGETEDIFDCPICCASIDCFMVFTCGHRICQNCFEKMRALQRRAGSAEDVVACPTCRVVNRSKQVMVAQSGHVQDKSAIPGIILSAKMSEAIILMREILAADPLNKIILFTTIEQTSTQVWEYLTKILKLANLPFIAPTRATCGKKVFDFDVSEDTKVLLCSLSLCANGLNMTGANHIIFLDPPHLQSVLNQAIGRINRFGQKRDMNVYHLLVDGSLDIELRETAKKTYRREDEQKGWTIGDIRSMFGINYYPVQANIRAIVGNVDGNFHRMQEFFRNNIVRRAIP